MDKFAKDCFKPEQTAADISHDCKAKWPLKIELGRMDFARGMQDLATARRQLI